ncbi:hypothetical protein GIB67_026684 [Kingdonia uniflora]|uniref:Uncharacterized protein n=1 Tax=Kingdonia uniflora TaxID=39325 RepID=A0A7J7MGW0_9MAGN|nr:hypothetical protein GIB67_026684 [Kingdonia uniflora]
MGVERMALKVTNANSNTGIFNIVDFGAVANGRSDNAKAFLDAWNQACAWMGYGRVLIPHGTFLVGPVSFKGPFKAPIVFKITGKSPSRVAISDVSFKNIGGTSRTKLAVKILYIGDFHVEGWNLANINLQYIGSDGPATLDITAQSHEDLPAKLEDKTKECQALKEKNTNLVKELRLRAGVDECNERRGEARGQGWPLGSNYLFHGESTQHSQSDANASIPVEAAAPQKEKRKGRKKRAPAKQRPRVQVPEDYAFLDETDNAGMHWTDADFTCLAREWITTSVQINGRTKCFTFYQKVIVAQERFRNSSGKIEEDWVNNGYKIYKGLNGGNEFKHHEAYKILAREPRWANLRDDGLNHAVNIPRNVVRRISDNSSPRNSVGSNNLSEDPDGPPTPQSVGPNSDLDGSLYEGGSWPIGQKLYRKNLASQKAMEGVTASGSDVQKILDELRLEKIQAKEENERRRAETMQH